MGNHKKIDPNAWMISFSDMLTLMLTFFVLLLSMANVDTLKLRNALSLFPGSVAALYEGAGRGAGTVGESIYSGPTGGEVRVGSDKMRRDIQQIIELARLGKGKFFGGALKESFVQVYTDRRGLVLSFMDDILFEKGKVTLFSEALPMIKATAELIEKYKLNVVVEGHTGPSPPSAGGFDTNWELSVARAGVVLRHLREMANLPPDTVSVAGYGAAKPLFPNDTEEHKRRNQRVELALYKKGGGSIWELGQW